ncbi:hypothetical protein [Thiolapillus sp.]|uniref:hypothetical protein n=1 Tax=Thiolapillus sp. TaxID=2017437 RepID=UPI003AF944F9
MRAERLADRLVIMPEPQEGNKRLMRLYFTYRVMLAIGLLVFSVAGIGPSFLGSESTDLHIITVLAYLVLSIASLTLSFLAPQQNLWVAEVGLRQMIRSVLSG